MSHDELLPCVHCKKVPQVVNCEFIVGKHCICGTSEHLSKMISTFYSNESISKQMKLFVKTWNARNDKHNPFLEGK